LEYGKGKDFDSNSSGWEHHRGLEKGTDFASHIERLLMLWFAAETLREFEIDKKPVERLLKGLHNIRKIRSRVTAEILLNREPCKNCRDFQEMLELVTGLKFKVTLIPTLGNLALKRNENGRAFFPIKSTEVLEDGEDYGMRLQTSSKSKCQVVIPVRSEGPSIESALPAAPKTTKRPHNRSHYRDEESSVISVKTQVTISKASKLVQSYAYQMSSTNLEATRQRQRFLDESEDDDEEFVPRTPIKFLDSQTRKTTRSGLATPNSTPFAPEALLAAKKIRDEKKRRLRERESSPSSGGKNKRSKKE
jgi:hypothetical protein